MTPGGPILNKIHHSQVPSPGLSSISSCQLSQLHSSPGRILRWDLLSCLALRSRVGAQGIVGTGKKGHTIRHLTMSPDQLSHHRLPSTRPTIISVLPCSCTLFSMPYSLHPWPLVSIPTAYPCHHQSPLHTRPHNLGW